MSVPDTIPVDHTPAAPSPIRVGQATAVEQSRAVAEVQAAVVVAQQVPRSISTARTAMQASCQQLRFAEKAFYRYPKGGKTVTGPSVHLARELARCFGNVQYGISELRRDDIAAESEMLAWAWDVQMNTRASTTFIVPHKRDTSNGAKQLVDMRDIYENNANMGARRLREQIFAILPTWFNDEAIDLCQATMHKGDGRPLEERIDGAVRVFDAKGVAVDRLEQKLGRPREKWNEYDISQLLITHRSIERGEVSLDEEFPPTRVTVAEVTATEPPTPASGPDGAAPVEAPEEPSPPSGQVDQRPPTKAQNAKLFALLDDLDIKDDDKRREWAARHLDLGEPTSFTELDRAQYAQLIDIAEGQVAFERQGGES